MKKKAKKIKIKHPIFLTNSAFKTKAKAKDERFVIVNTGFNGKDVYKIE
jgi:hypothetical protein